jgi:hypothetical protein
MIRPIGREFRDSSPDITEEKDCPDRMPDISLVVVPLFPTSKVPCGADNPRSPWPCTMMLPVSSVILIPILRKQAMVDRQSAPFRKFVIFVVPRATAPNMMLLWEIDLSPGIVSSPFSPILG